MRNLLHLLSMCALVTAVLCSLEASFVRFGTWGHHIWVDERQRRSYAGTFTADSRVYWQRRGGSGAIQLVMMSSWPGRDSMEFHVMVIRRSMMGKRWLIQSFISMLADR